jgi:hypothetical protein
MVCHGALHMVVPYVKRDKKWLNVIVVTRYLLLNTSNVVASSGRVGGARLPLTLLLVEVAAAAVASTSMTTSSKLAADTSTSRSVRGDRGT